VAIGMEVFLASKQLPEEAIGTISFIKNMNALFDVVNLYNGNFGSPGNITFLLEMKNIFLNMQVMRRGGKNVTRQMKCLQCWVVTINTLIQLWEEMGKGDLITRRLNSDPNENFFGTIRQQCGNATNPTAIQFTRAFKKLFLLQYFEHSQGANCLDDLSLALQSILAIPTEQLSITITNDVTSNTNTLAVYAADYRELDVPTTNKFVYISGYLYNKCLIQHSCETCKNYCLSNLDETSLFTHLRSFHATDENVFGKFVVPAHPFVLYVVKLEEMFFEKFNSVAADLKVGHQLKLLLKGIKFEHPCSQFPLEYLINLFIRFRIFTTLKQLTKNMISQPS
jgi:hypothetical protein